MLNPWIPKEEKLKMRLHRLVISKKKIACFKTTVTCLVIQQSYQIGIYNNKGKFERIDFKENILK